MATHGKMTGILIGQDNPTGFLRDLGITGSTDTAEATPFMVQDKVYVAGQSDATVSMGGMFEGSLDATTRIFETIQDGSAGDPFLAVFGGWLLGNRCRLGITLRTQFDVSSPVSDIVSVSGNLQSTGGMHTGVLVRSPDDVLTLANSQTFTGPTVDMGVAPVGVPYTRLLAQLHVLQSTLASSATFRVQTSINGTTWVDLITTTVGVREGRQLVSTGLPARYIRITCTAAATGAGTIQFATAVARV